ncbi:hypothetical protein [Halalkalibacter sp. APA_J-10(15)]|uniref:hypothetical protein n=1 Tax=Halalkalibacter sp. APA_J-10(15) TaxID=2933805 RepID=UPI001FF240AD|nr:hypothetical protein [Halalkalibacter sp. APA_J-10(15)]MCK0473751.1 hypothetical protein [Halalkalibacter sp. APA_J-10(15)]
MSNKKWWLLSGVIYLILVIGGYSLVTGANPLESGNMHSDHSEESHETFEDHNENASMDHHEHQHDSHSHFGESQSQVEIHIHQANQKLIIHFEDEEGDVPELIETHEKLMHLILVSGDLEEFHHFHPEEVESGTFEKETDLPDGHYYAFVDIHPVGKSYVVEPQEVMIGEHHGESGEMNLQPDSDLVKSKSGKEVELVTTDLNAGESVELAFDLKGETPEPYLGALGHVVIIDERVDHFIHVHPKSDDSTEFEAYFPHEGVYKLWAEFKYNDEGVMAFPFVLEVE